MSTRYPLEGLVSMYAEKHVPDETRGGCSCGFCAWSPSHVAIMAYREAADFRATDQLIQLEAGIVSPREMRE